MKSKRFFIITLLALAILLILFVGLGAAQEADPETPSSPDEPSLVEAVSAAIPIQGRLTDASSNPLNGTYDLTFRLYATPSGGTALCEDTDLVDVVNGLFSAYVNSCTSSDINGRQLYLGIQVAGDSEMTPRQAIYSVPYAFSLKPGAVISTSGWPALHVETTNPSGRAFRAYATATSGTNYGMVGASKSPDGYGGYFYNNSAGGGTGLRAWSEAAVGLEGYSYAEAGNDYPGVFGCAADSASVCNSYKDDSPSGVLGYGSFGVDGVGTSIGVRGQSSTSYGFGGYFQHTDGGIALVADSVAAANDDIVRIRNNYNVRFKVQGDGDVYIDGSYHSGGADFAEQIAVTGDEAAYEPGDVLVISASADRMVELSAEPFATAVIGVYSTKPGILAGVPDTNDSLEGIPVAITGIVPCKVSAENGPIQRGDLLVTASMPGYAMRAGDNPPQGAVLGKAMGELTEGTGVIQALVTLQ